MAPIRSPDANRFENHTAAGGGLFVVACLVGLLVASYPVTVTLTITLVAMLVGG